MPNPPFLSPSTQRLEPHPWLVFRDSAAGMAAPRVRQLMRVVEPIQASSISLDAQARFHADPALFALPVVDPLMRPVALIQRHVFLEFLGRLYSRELFGKRTLSDLLAEYPAGLHIQRHMVVDANTSTDDVAQIIVQSDMRHMVSGFIVTEGEAYAGVASGQDLLNEITQRKQAQLYFAKQTTRSLSDLSDRSEPGGRARTGFPVFEVHSGTMQRKNGEIWPARPTSAVDRSQVRQAPRETLI